MSMWAISEEGTKRCGWVFGIFYWPKKDGVFKRQVSPAIVELKDGSLVKVDMNICETPEDIAGQAKAIVKYYEDLPPERKATDHLPMVEKLTPTQWQKMKTLLLAHGWTEEAINEALAQK